MPDDRHLAEPAEAQPQAQQLAALLDAAAEDLERSGPVSPAELRRHLEALEAEWSGAPTGTPPNNETSHSR